MTREEKIAYFKEKKILENKLKVIFKQLKKFIFHKFYYTILIT